jgi:hypothetical protein
MELLSAAKGCMEVLAWEWMRCEHNLDHVEVVVYMNQQDYSRCNFHLQSRLLLSNVYQLSKMSVLAGIPWGPGGVHGSKNRAIAWGQAMFCRGGSVTPDIPPEPQSSEGLMYVGWAKPIKAGTGEDKYSEEVSTR